MKTNLDRRKFLSIAGISAASLAGGITLGNINDNDLPKSEDIVEENFDKAFSYNALSNIAETAFNETCIVPMTIKPWDEVVDVMIGPSMCRVYTLYSPSLHKLWHPGDAKSIYNAAVNMGHKMNRDFLRCCSLSNYIDYYSVTDPRFLNSKLEIETDTEFNRDTILDMKQALHAATGNTLDTLIIGANIAEKLRNEDIMKCPVNKFGPLYAFGVGNIIVSKTPEFNGRLIGWSGGLSAHIRCGVQSECRLYSSLFKSNRILNLRKKIICTVFDLDTIVSMRTKV